MSTIAPVVAILNDLPASTASFSPVAPSMLAGVAVALFAVTFVLMRVVKGLVAAVTTVVGPLLKLLGVLTVVAVVLMAALFARDTPAPPPQSLTKGLLVAADK